MHWHTAGLGLTQVCASLSEPSRTDTVHGQRGRGTGPAGYAVLAYPDLVFRTHPSSWRIPLRKDLLSQGPGTLASASRSRDVADLVFSHRWWKSLSLRPEPSLRGELSPRSGVCSRFGVLVLVRTPEDARLDSAFFPARRVGV